MAVDMAKLDRFMGQMVGEMGAAFNGALILIGDRLGLYKAMAGAGAMTAEELAKKTNTNERYIREWLSAQAAGGMVTYNAKSKKFTLPEEQALALAHEDSPAFLPGAFEIIASVVRDEEKIIDAFRTGKGLGWHEHDHGLFHGTNRFFRPSYLAHLVSEWIPALEGVEKKLKRGAKVADVGCGHGASTILMAKAYPVSQFWGFDYHDESIMAAKLAAKKEGVAERVTFEVAPAKSFPRGGYHLVTFFDCLHDMGDPAGAAKHVKSTLAPDGTWMVVEPKAGDKLEENLNPVGRMFYCASTTICTPASKSQEVGLALGAQAGQKRLAEVIKEGGFRSVRRAAETPFNIVLEAK